jgi:DNA-directed RNA polymerase specialized sigma24 family protein
VADFLKRVSVYIDTPEGPRPIEQKNGEKLNFLYDALVQARAADVGVKDATDALFKEVSDYYGVVLRREANLRRWHLPGSDPAEDDMTGPTQYRPDFDAPDRLDKLLPPETRYEAATKVFLELDTYKGKSQFHTWAYRIIKNVIADAITELMRVRASRFSGKLPEGFTLERHGKMRVNIEELKTVRRLDHSNDAKMSEDIREVKNYAFYFRLRQQSIIDQRFIKLVIDAKKGSYGAIAKKLRWPLKKVYYRIAKFKKLGFLVPNPVDLRKREYNRRSRGKLVKSN